MFATKLPTCQPVNLSTYAVRMIGVEPTCLAAPDPKSGASANFATSATVVCKNSPSRATTNGGAKLRFFLYKMHHNGNLLLNL